MTVYTVLAPPMRHGDSAPDPLGYVLVKEGFCWPALLIPELWLLFRRMWLVFLLYLILAVGMTVAGGVLGYLSGAVMLLARLFLGLEGNNLRRWTMERRGYALAGVAEGKNRDEADIRFFADWPDTVPTVPATGAAADDGPEPAPPPASAENGGVVGLFPAPGGGA